jgi:hypothetical protein
MNRCATALGATGLGLCHVVWAGGTDSPVRVISVVTDGTSYTLSVEPTAEARNDPYLGGCKTFTVHGTYGRLRGELFSRPPMLSREGHLQALTVLSKAAAAHETIRLGAMGSGFEVSNASKPCDVKSRALWLVSDEHGQAIYSFHNAI